MPQENRPKRSDRAHKSERAAGTHHAADEPIIEADSPEAGVRRPKTETGLYVEEQIRKEWDPKRKGGLPTSLNIRLR